MKNRKYMLISTCLPLLVAAAVGAVAQEREEPFARRIELGAGGELYVSNISGEIRVAGTGGTELVIESVKRLHGDADRSLFDEVEIDISEVGNRVRVETRYPRGGHRGHHRGGVSVDYRITLPRDAEVEANSVSGDVTVENIEGAVRAGSVSGSVTASEVTNLVEAKSVSGDVDVRNASSARDARIESVSGDVTIDGLETRELEVQSVSGDVRVDSVSSERGTLSSTSGDIRYTGRIAPGGRYEFKTHSGDVVLAIGDEVGFELEASTFSGDIDSAFPMRVTSTDRSGRKLTGVVGDGSALIEATTFSGDVRIRSR
ncbi:MAG TPA: DUF4097 family beta strand repeat-containing protein [Vicinamibacteria bacterium]|nr:DUF4097 family beta strand repeat-containing protein [Vicinamibacteria bacterium]